MNKETLFIPGLIDQVEIITDRWGIPHIYAANQQDLFFAQGYNAAKDRLFQFEMWRRRALGLLAEIQGEKALQHDIGARLLQFRGDIQKEFQHYHKDGKEIILSFVAGVNAYITTARNSSDPLPVEFRLLNIEPAYWSPEVVVSRHNALTGGAETELMIAKLISSVGADMTGSVLAFSRSPDLNAKEGIDLDDISEDITAYYKASRTPPAFTEEDIGLRLTTQHAEELSSLNAYNDLAPEALGAINSVGSNNWVIAGSKTQSGYPIMANDPHRVMDMPSLRYWAHLIAPGWNVIGGGEPVLPGISIGHNEYGAWGLTIFPIDQEDIYVYEVNPENPNQYWYNGRWEAMTLVEEQIPIKQQSLHQVTLKYTRHGPVLYEDNSKNRAYALRATWLDVGSAPYLASLRIDQAKNWEEFRLGCAYSHLPGENMVWADREGNIGWQAVGATPIRNGWDGLLPVPGDGRYEWAGYVPLESMPYSINPKEGHWQSANHYNVPDSNPTTYSFLSASPYRLNRIKSVLEQGDKFTVEDSIALQYDVTSLPAKLLVPLLSQVKHLPIAMIVQQAINRVLEWDCVLSADSVEAGIYSQWKKALNSSLIDKARVDQLSEEKLVEWLLEPEKVSSSIFGNDASQGRDQLLVDCMVTAVEALTKTLGSEMSGWQYGQEKYHHSKMTHPLSHLVDDKLDIGPVPVGGDESTVNLNFGDQNQLIGASFRIIVDTSNWDSTRGTNTPGQSGDPDSPHYDDMFNLWAKGEYFPVYYSREKVESVASQVTMLNPQLDK